MSCTRSWYWGVSLIWALCCYSNLSVAAWVAINVEQPTWETDHMHVVVSDNDSPEDAAMLNLWEGRAYSVNFSRSLIKPRKVLVFKSSRTKDEIVTFWNNYFESAQHFRSNFSLNCAVASGKVFEFAFGKPMVRSTHTARVWGCLSVPDILCPVTLPESVYKNAKKTLEVNRIWFKTESDITRYLGKNEPELGKVLLELSDENSKSR